MGQQKGRSECVLLLCRWPMSSILFFSWSYWSFQTCGRLLSPNPPLPSPSPTHTHDAAITDGPNGMYRPSLFQYSSQMQTEEAKGGKRKETVDGRCWWEKIVLAIRWCLCVCVCAHPPPPSYLKSNKKYSSRALTNWLDSKKKIKGKRKENKRHRPK